MKHALHSIATALWCVVALPLVLALLIAFKLTAIVKGGRLDPDEHD
jgi:hypothetical protein